jgi:hypothetical protein
MTDPRLYVVTLRAPPGADGLRALRAALKHLWRAHRLRCISVTTDHEPDLLGTLRTIDRGRA